MSQNFKLKYDQMKESNPTPPASSVEPQAKAFDDFYTEEGNVRNICFVWKDGKRKFLNYAYLISGEYSPAENTIILTFTTHTVLLKGIHLEGLFDNIMGQLSKQVVCMDKRYNLIEESERFVVNDIEITKS